jgi:hypothetical protein
MEDIVKIFKREIVDKMDLSLKVKSITNAGLTLNVCNIKWARKGKYVENELAVKFQIVDVDPDLNTITLAVPFIGNEVTIYKPFYFYGTPTQVNSEWGAVTKIEVDKIPFIWLIEPMNENPFGKESAIERESEIRAIFVDGRFVTNWKVKDIHEFRVQPLLNMTEEYQDTVNKNRLFKRVTDYRSKTLTKLGSETEQGFLKNILDANLTAIDVRHTLPIYKTYKCNC